MSISILYFARIREALDCEREQFNLTPAMGSVQDVIDALAARGEPWQSTLADEQLLIAVNQSVAKANSPIAEGDELAFFPPVTGG